jgi:hypothetical protein
VIGDTKLENEGKGDQFAGKVQNTIGGNNATREVIWGSTKPVGDNARKGAVRKRSQLATKTQGEAAWTKRSRKGPHGGEFMARKEGKKYKGVRVER